MITGLPHRRFRAECPRSVVLWANGEVPGWPAGPARAEGPRSVILTLK